MLRLMVLVAALAAPLAAAGAPAEGEARFAALRLSAAADVEADAGLLDLGDAARPGAGLVLSWARASGHLVTSAYDDAPLPGPLHLQARNGRARDPVAFGPGEAANLTCWAPCQVLLLAEGAGVLGLRGGAALGDVAWTREAEVRHAGFPARGDPHAFYYDVPKGWLAAGGAGELPLSDAAPRAEGALTLLLVNATADVRAQGEAARLDARETTAQGLAAPQRVARFYLLRLEGARLAAEGPAPARLVAPAWRLATQGEVEAPRATGWVEAGGERRAFEDARLLVRGDVAWALRVDDGALLASPEPLAGAFSGRADALLVGADVLARGAPAPARAAAAGATLAALALAALLLLRGGLLAALYSRLDRPKVAAHPQRRRLQEALRAAPGQGPTQLARGLGLARVVVQHHLRVLHAHGMVVRRERGAALVYYLPEHAPDAAAVALPVAIRNPTTERLARALAATHAPATQQDLSARTGIHPRLVSYHLGKLGRAGLVVVRDGTPRRYEASPRFRDFLGRRAPAADASG